MDGTFTDTFSINQTILKKANIDKFMTAGVIFIFADEVTARALIER